MSTHISCTTLLHFLVSLITTTEFQCEGLHNKSRSNINLEQINHRKQNYEARTQSPIFVTLIVYIFIKFDYSDDIYYPSYG